jgi:hypothetical protein
VHSHADWIVANTLEGMHEWAYFGCEAGRYRRMVRAELADALIGVLESNVEL